MTKHTLPVVEIFGPTIQGEGPMVGTPCSFIRLAGCDYRCVWCDSLHAVLPEEFKVHAKELSVPQIMDELGSLGNKDDVYIPDWVVLSGGNPLIWDLEKLVKHLHWSDYKVAVETQGTIWRPWLNGVDFITVSPKPPSSGMVRDWARLENFMARTWGQNRVLKVVIMNKGDLDYAVEIRKKYLDEPMYLSMGTLSTRFFGKAPEGYLADTSYTLLTRYDQYRKSALKHPLLKDVPFLPQLHVLVWGHRQGV